MIPITIFSGFLGAGKTTLIRTLLQKHKSIRFGLIINEFGEVGIDGELVKTALSGEQIVEISDGCLCCVVRSDLKKAVEAMIETGEVDYILIETSGLAEPAPVAQTFLMDDLNDRVKLDAVVCVLDCVNFSLSLDNYHITLEQVEFADIIVLNKLLEASEDQIISIRELIAKVNPQAAVLENTDGFSPSLLIDANAWTSDRIEKTEFEEEDEHHHEHEHGEDCDENCEHNHDHSDHHHHDHEHNEVDEVVFSTSKILNPHALDEWFATKLPIEVVRAKGFLRLKEGADGVFLFQMVGARRSVTPYTSPSENFDATTTRIVFIGKKLPKELILKTLGECVL